MKELTVQSQDAGQRFDKFLAKYLKAIHNDDNEEED